MKINFRFLYIILIPLIIWAVIRLYFHSRYSFGGDEAEYMNNAWRVLSGGMPYKDFWLLFPPAEVYFPALVLRLVGVHLGIFFWGDVVTALLAVLLFCLVLKELGCPPLFALLAGFLILLMGQFFFFSVLCLASCYFLLLYRSGGKRYLILASGFVAGLALLFRVYQVAPYCIAAIAFLFVGKESTRVKMRHCFLLVASAGVPVLLAIILLHGIAGTMFYAVMVDAVEHGTAMHISYWNPVVENWNKLFTYYYYSHNNRALFPMKGILLMACRFLAGLFIRIVPFIVLICFVTDVLSKSLDNSFNGKLLLIIWGILYLPYAINLPGNTHIIQAYMPLLILVYSYIYEAFTRMKYGVVKALLAGCAIIILFTSAVTLYDVFKPTDYKHYTIATNTGSFITIDKEEYQTLSGIINTISTNTSKNDFIFSLSWNAPPLYALTERQDATYYDSPIDLLIRPATWKENNIITTLENKKPKVAVVETNIELINGLLFDVSKRLPLLDAYIKGHYRLESNYGLYDVYLLK